MSEEPEFRLEEYHRNISNEEFIGDIKSIALKLGKISLSMIEYQNHGKYHPTTVFKRLGSWTEALKLAGLNVRKYQNIPEEELFRNLEEVWIKLGRQPHHKDMKEKFSKYSPKTYVNRYGTWRKALEAFVAFINTDTSNDDATSAINHPSSSKEDISNILSKHKTSRNINWRLRFIIMLRDNFKCKICGSSPATDPKSILQVDHIVAWSNGGETLPENLQTLCSVCNIGKSNLTV